MMEYKSIIKAFLANFIPNYKFQEDEDIFARGYVNSLFAMQLVLFVEKEFNIAVENEDLNIDNFKTINAINCLIERKRGSEKL